MRSCYLSVLNTGVKWLGKEVITSRSGLLVQRSSNLVRRNSPNLPLFLTSSQYHTSFKLSKDDDKNVIDKKEEKAVVKESETEVKLSDNEDKAKKTIKLSTARKQKKQKRGKKIAPDEHKRPEDLVKKVSAELNDGNNENERQIEHQLLMQLLKIEKKSISSAQQKQESTSLFTKLTQKEARKAVSRNARTRLNLFTVSKNSIDATTARERSNDKIEWSCSDWLNSMEENLQNDVFNVPYPGNAFEEQIMWTEEGKLFKFPIDNEQGVDEAEILTPFYQHVFLQSKLEDWCPRVGAIGDFMKALCTALSMNPHLTVVEKHQHIEWFRDYFNEKSNLLTALGLLDVDENKKSISSS